MDDAKEIATWLETVTFKKTWVGGVSEADVWKKIRKLNGLYAAALTKERLRFETLRSEKDRYGS
ncbi:MAG: hypothetical protein IJP30_06235 [Clostridia bacterium]|nr:hypothetical protein [Clostridia bacterium]